MTVPRVAVGAGAGAVNRRVQQAVAIPSASHTACIRSGGSRVIRSVHSETRIRVVLSAASAQGAGIQAAFDTMQSAHVSLWRKAPGAPR